MDINDFRTEDAFTAKYQPYDIRKIIAAALEASGVGAGWQDFEAQQEFLANMESRAPEWFALLSQAQAAIVRPEVRRGDPGGTEWEMRGSRSGE